MRKLLGLSTVMAGAAGGLYLYLNGNLKDETIGGRIFSNRLSTRTSADMRPKDISRFTKGFTTKAVHAWHEIDSDTGSITPPIHLASTYQIYTDRPMVFYCIKDRNTYMGELTILLELSSKRP